MAQAALMPISAYGAALSSEEGVHSEGEIYPTRQSEMLQASAGLGRGSPFRPLAPFGASPDGIGAYAPGRATRDGSLGLFGGSPLARSIQALRRKRGLGDDAIVSSAPQVAGGVLVAAVVLGLAVTGVASYYVGKAIAPSRDKESKYAWWGVFAGLVGGPVGLGIEAGVALSHKGSR